MKHIIIQVESIMKYPPTLSLLYILRELGEEVLLITSSINDDITNFCNEHKIKVYACKTKYKEQSKAIAKLINIFPMRKQIWEKTRKIEDNHSIYWVMTSVTLKYVGREIIKKSYIVYMYELIEKLRYYNKLPFPKVPLEKICKYAKAVIECEYNRAHIAKAWYRLENLPWIIPNKPYLQCDIEPRSFIHNEEARKLIKDLSSKKILIYQGVIDEERPIDHLINAVNELGEEFALIVMSSNCDKLKKKKTKNLYLIPFIAPPYHLEITSWAWAGILIYQPVLGGTTSPLNSLYCAPNKLYEYAMFGLPMLGNCIPGLQQSIEANVMGVCADITSIISIKDGINKIRENYEQFCKNSLLFYKKVDSKKIVSDILKEISKEC